MSRWRRQRSSGHMLSSTARGSWISGTPLVTRLSYSRFAAAAPASSVLSTAAPFPTIKRGAGGGKKNPSSEAS